MYQVFPVLFLLLVGCSRDEGSVLALIQPDPGLQATCIALDVLSPSGQVIRTQLLPRPEGKQEFRIAVLPGEKPQDIQLQARALWGTECQEPLFYNGRSKAVPTRFESGVTGSVTLTLFRPDPSEDADQDGFVAAALGGPDCDDSRGDSSPKAQQEVCDASADLNCNGQLGCDDALCSGVSTCLRVATSLTFMTSPISAGVGECVPVPVERRDRNGQPAAPNHRTEFQPSASNLEGLSFHANSDCKSASLSTVSIDEKQISATFYVRGIRIGDRQLLATSTGLEHVWLNYALRSGDAAKIVFVSPDRPISAGTCSPVILQRQDEFANPTTSGPMTVTLSLPSATAQTAFYSGDLSCGPSEKVTQANFPVQTSSLKVNFKSERANVFPLKVTGIGPELTRNQIVLPLPPAQVDITLTAPSGGKTLLADECSPNATVKTLDVYGNASSPAVGPLVPLVAPAENNVSFFSDAECKNSISTAPFSGTANTADFYFKVKSGGVFNLKESLSKGFESFPQSVTVAPLVRRNQCTLPANTNSIDCPVSPRLNDLNKSFLVFQATTQDDAARSSYVRCYLKDLGTINCSRYQSSGSGVANIQWQIVERASGLTVQHKELSCTSGTGVSSDISPVALGKAFLLVSSSHDGTIASANDFVTARFNGNSKVDIAMSAMGACNKEKFSLQVVEFEGASVTRGTTDQMVDRVPSPIEEDTLFTLEDASHSILLSTFQTHHNDAGLLCNRMVRGEIGPRASKLSFSRGASRMCDMPEVPVIAWERIQFPANVTVQQKVLDAPDGVGVVAAPISFVDMTRTLLLTSTQVSSGQGNGETSHVATDTLGVGTGRLRFTSPTEVELARDDARDTSRWTVYAAEFNP